MTAATRRKLSCPHCNEELGPFNAREYVTSITFVYRKHVEDEHPCMWTEYCNEDIRDLIADWERGT